MKITVHIESMEKTGYGGFLFYYYPIMELTQAQKCKVDGAFKKKVKQMLYPFWFWQKKLNACDLIGSDIEVEI